MQRLVHVDNSGARHFDVDPSRLGECLDDGWVWVDLFDPTDDELRALASRFSLDRMTRDDLGDEPQFPKVDDVGAYVVLVTHSLAPDETKIRTVEVDFVLGPNWLITVHDEPLLGFDHVADRIRRPAFAVSGPDHLLTRLVEFSSERFLPLLDALDGQILDLDDRAILGDPAVLPDIQLLRREISVLRRVLVPQRTALSILQRNEGLGDRARRELSDAMDHHMRLVETLDAAHNLLLTTLDTYRGATAERMNEIMKILTVFSAIVLPLSLIAGIYGMNFQNMPELQKDWAYPVTMSVMAVVAVGLWLYFARRGFIGGPSLSKVATAGRGAVRVAGGAARVGVGAARVGVGLASLATEPVRSVGRAVRGVATDDEISADD